MFDLGIKHSIFLISKGISDQIFIALYLSISMFSPDFERVFGNANCRVSVFLVLYE